MGDSAMYMLSQDDLNKVASIAGREAVRVFREEQKKAAKKYAREEDKVRKTKRILSSYRRMKATLSEDTEFTEKEKIELRWRFIEDLMGSPDRQACRSERAAIDSEKKRQENLYCIHCIENAVRSYKEECDRSSNEEYRRRYRELHYMYIAEDPLTVREIAELEDVSEKTVYKDLGIACSIIAVYLLGM